MKKKKLQHIKFKENPFKIPKGYFETVEDDVFAKISAENFPKKGGFSDPSGYFDNVENKIIKKLHDDEGQIKTGFEVPENYFESLEKKVVAKISTADKPSKVIDFKSIILKRIIPIAVAASLLLIIYLNSNGNKNTTFESIASTDIELWIENDLITLDANDIAEVYKDTELDNQEIFVEDELEDYLIGIDVESLLYEN